MSENLKTKKNVDMINGKLFGKIIVFAVPLMLSGLLQLLFNAADLVVIGRFGSTQSQAAVGSTSSLVHLVVNIFIGLSIGANVVMSRALGASDRERAQRTVHTAIVLSLISGIIVAIVGVFGAETFLTIMNTEPGVLKKSTLYLQIYFAGSPFPMIYNFGASLLRAKGDTRRPLIFLTVAGVVNVALNLFFVLVCKMDVAGVALGTVISQAVSAVLVVICLIRESGECKLSVKKLRVHKSEFLEIARVGLPAGIFSSFFSLSNVIIQSSINGFGSDIIMNGNANATSLENFVYIVMNAIYNAAITFTGQNCGAGKYERIKYITRDCLFIVFVVGLGLGMVELMLAEPLAKIYSKNADVVDYTVRRMSITMPIYFMCGIMEVLTGVLRGMGYSMQPMFISLMGACLLRVVWVYTVFKKWHTLKVLYMVYPVSWAVTSIALGVLLTVAYLKLVKSKKTENVSPPPETQE